jgi:hypothetical protein
MATTRLTRVQAPGTADPSPPSPRATPTGAARHPFYPHFAPLRICRLSTTRAAAGSSLRSIRHTARPLSWIAGPVFCRADRRKRAIPCAVPCTVLSSVPALAAAAGKPRPRLHCSGAAWAYGLPGPRDPVPPRHRRPPSTPLLPKTPPRSRCGRWAVRPRSGSGFPPSGSNPRVMRLRLAPDSSTQVTPVTDHDQAGWYEHSPTRVRRARR